MGVDKSGKDSDAPGQRADASSFGSEGGQQEPPKQEGRRMVRHSIDWPREYLAFIGLFNGRDFFEAHEVLEDLWVVEVPPLKEFYKGLIQWAVALCHWKRGNHTGARMLYLSGARYLDPYPDRFEGLDLGGLRREMGTLFDAWAHDASARPQVPAEDCLPILRHIA